MSSAAEMSDLVCRCRELSGARTVITRALFTHTDTHSVESFFVTRRTFAEIFFVLPLFSLYIKLINCSPELPAAPLWSQLSLLRLPLPGKHQRCTLWPIVERGWGVNGTSVTSSRNLGIFRVFFCGEKHDQRCQNRIWHTHK